MADNGDVDLGRRRAIYENANQGLVPLPFTQRTIAGPADLMDAEILAVHYLVCNLLEAFDDKNDPLPSTELMETILARTFKGWNSDQTALTVPYNPVAWMSHLCGIHRTKRTTSFLSSLICLIGTFSFYINEDAALRITLPESDILDRARGRRSVDLGD